MKCTKIATALSTVLTAALLTICPIASRAANYSPDSREPAAESTGAAQCPTKQQAPPAGCEAAGSAGGANGSSVMRLTEEDGQQGSEQSDLSGALLEDLVKDHPGRPETEL